MESAELPPALIAEIKRGNCVAFVGAGFAGPARLPTWGALLEGILSAARSLGRLVSVDGGEDAFVEHVKAQIDRRTAEGFDRAAQLMVRHTPPPPPPPPRRDASATTRGGASPSFRRRTCWARTTSSSC